MAIASRQLKHVTRLPLFLSTWTIDLVYLLHRYEVQQRYCTITRGIDPGYHRQSFYGYGKVLRMVRTRRAVDDGRLWYLLDERIVMQCKFYIHVISYSILISIYSYSILYSMFHGEKLADSPDACDTSGSRVTPVTCLVRL